MNANDHRQKTSTIRTSYNICQPTSNHAITLTLKPALASTGYMPYGDGCVHPGFWKLSGARSAGEALV